MYREGHPRAALVLADPLFGCFFCMQMARLKCAAQGPTMMSSQMHLCSASAGSGSAVNNHHHHHHDSSDQIDGGHLSRIDAFDHGPPPAMLTPQVDMR